MKEKLKNSVLIKQWLFPIISVLLTTAYMPIFLYATNSGEVNFSEALLPLGIFFLIAIVIMVLAILVTKSPTKMSLIASLFILLLENYHYCEKGIQYLVSSAKYWHILPVCIFLVLHVCYVVCVVLKEETRKMISTIVGFVMGALILVNFISAIPNIISKINVNEKKNEVVVDNTTTSDNDGANIYYFLLDEAAPFNVIEDVYDSDMSEFREFLLENHFMISEDSYNDSIYTKVVLTNLLNLDYVADDLMSDAQLTELRNNSTLSQILEEVGYSLYGVGTTEWLSIDSLTVEQKGTAETIDGRNFVQTIMSTTFLYPFFEKNYTEEQKNILDAFNYFFEDIYNTHSEFKFVYLNCPHQPFLFDENGKDNLGINYHNWEDEKYYLGQYKYVMKKVQEIIECILENDSNSIIIVASDHGPRFNPEILSEKKTNILQAVYYKGKNIDDINGLSGVNTLRSILSKQLSIELPLVEVP